MFKINGEECVTSGAAEHNQPQMTNFRSKEISRNSQIRNTGMAIINQLFGHSIKGE